ncbi:EAL domain-containing protein [Neptunomonas sp. XY-337]|uniref:bifunctional diguanylate cyclase/phosphodiesterase n=1 Tax=Neptunomonas sp. XY-337 TaxID=2561897 RepID=UPI0010AA5A4D|nr:EAL domain-containing protein [Neptunomonas sp. XY-337]
MSLLNQLIAAVFAVLIGLVSGTVFVMSDSAKNMLLRQLESHGQDTATHLGLYLAPYIAEGDSATIEATVNAIFDSGYYQQIRVTQTNGDVLFTTPAPTSIQSQAPQWFDRLIDITPPSMSQEVSFNWQRVGKVEVSGRPDYAYQQLWKGVEQSLIWFISLALMAVFALSYLIRRILRPLKRVEQQAAALSNRQFITVAEVPNTTELRQVVEAMNKMVSRVQAMFNNQTHHIEELHQAASVDAVTGLANLPATESLLADWFDYRGEFGDADCIFLHLNKLQEANQSLGNDKTDLLLKSIGEQLKGFACQHQTHVTGRLAGSDFITVVPRSEEQERKREVDQLVSELNQTLAFYQLDGIEHLSIAVTQVDASSLASHIISKARSQAYEQAASDQQVCYPDTYANGAKVSAWQTYVVDAINQSRISLQYQSVIDTSGVNIIHNELLARIHNQAGEICPAAQFLTIVKEHNLASALDFAVLKMAVHAIRHHRLNGPLVVNLSRETIQGYQSSAWFDLLTSKELAGRLCIEVNETTILSDLDSIIPFRERLQSLGIDFGIDNFGQHPAGFSYLYSVHPDYIKIDGSLVRGVDKNAAGQFFIRSLIAAAKSLEITVFAERVESKQEAACLNEIGIDGTQGFLHGKPQPFSTRD